MAHTHNIDKDLAFAQESSEERVASFLAAYGKQIAIFAAGLLLCMLAAYAWYRVGQSHAITDYTDAEKAFEELQQAKAPQSPLAENPAYITLQKMIKSHPELESRYGGPLAQLALQQGDLKLAAQYAGPALQQLVAENLPFYEEFSKTSLLIAEGNDRDAYKRAAFLQKRMLEESQNANAGFSPSLLVMNQIRIASLMQRLNMKSEEAKAWRDVERLAALPSAEQGLSAASLLDTLKTGQVTLQDYIRSREK